MTDVKANLELVGVLVLLTCASGVVRTNEQHLSSSNAATKASQSGTPVQLVIRLLTRIDTQLAADGKKEAEQYDKYSCFCKEQADNKLYAIERSEAKEAELKATIADLEADIKILNTDIGKLGTSITALGKSIIAKVKARAKEHATFVSNDQEVSEAIDACERAIEALKGSKGDLQGNVEMEALVQLKNVATLALGFATRSNTGVTDAQWNTLGHLAKAGEPGDAYDYKYHSNDIIATLENLRLIFTKEKNDLYQAEFEANSMFDRNALALSNEKTFKEADKLEKEKIEAYKTELKETAVDDLAAEKDSREADERFMSVLTNDCQDKANLFDGRSHVRAKEVTLIHEVLDYLERGLEPNWKANRKLNGLLQIPPAKVAVKSSNVASMSSPPSFVQLRGAASTAAKVRKNVLTLLKGKAGSLKSSVLAMAALKIEAAEDHFVKVRSMINDIIATLEAQASAEATTKSFCDTQMKAAVTTRDAEQAKTEDLKAQITTKEADKAQLEADIAELSQQISDLTKALDEATELRMEEKADNLEIIRMAKEGQGALGHAMDILRNFYEEHEFLQYTPFKSANSDRAGNTVADLAPEYQALPIVTGGVRPPSTLSLAYAARCSQILSVRKTISWEMNWSRRGSILRSKRKRKMISMPKPS